MRRIGNRVGHVRRTAQDVVIGFMTFVVLAFGVTLDRTGGDGAYSDFGQLVSSRAHAAEYIAGSAYVNKPTASAKIVNGQAFAANPSVDMAFARTDQATAIVLLACIFSAVFAFNLAYYRRLRAVYASSRRTQAHRTGA